jgi:hypothetical protein
VIFHYGKAESSSAGADVSSADGFFNFADGLFCSADGFSNFADGLICSADGFSSFADGLICSTDGFPSSADGLICSSNGFSSSADGFFCFADGFFCSADGVFSSGGGSRSVHLVKISYYRANETSTEAAIYSHPAKITVAGAGLHSFALNFVTRQAPNTPDRASRTIDRANKTVGRVNKTIRHGDDRASTDTKTDTSQKPQPTSLADRG